MGPDSKLFLPNMRYLLERRLTEPAPVDTTHDGTNGSIHGVSSGSLTHRHALGSHTDGHPSREDTCPDLLSRPPRWEQDSLCR